MKQQNSDARPDAFDGSKAFSETDDGLYRFQKRVFYNKDNQPVNSAEGIGRRDGVRYIVGGNAYSQGLTFLGEFDFDKDTVKKAKASRAKSPLSKPVAEASNEADTESSSGSGLLD